jgi:hypothetical protein
MGICRTPCVDCCNILRTSSLLLLSTTIDTLPSRTLELCHKGAQIELLSVLALVMQLPKAGQDGRLPTRGDDRRLRTAITGCWRRAILQSKATT